MVPALPSYATTIGLHSWPLSAHYFCHIGVDMTEMDPELQRRYRRLFRFYDRQGDGVINMEGDFRQAAETLAARRQNRSAPFPNILELLIATYQHETERRDLNHDGVMNEQEFVDSHGPVVSAFARLPVAPARFSAVDRR